jgi:hypothetical protein
MRRRSWPSCTACVICLVLSTGRTRGRLAFTEPRCAGVHASGTAGRQGRRGHQDRARFARRLAIAFGLSLRLRTRRDPGGLARRTGPVPAVIAGLRLANRGAGGSGADPRRERRDGLIDHCVGFGSVPAPPQGVAKNTHGSRLHSRYEARRGQIPLKPRPLLAELSDPGIPRIGGRPAARTGQGGIRTGVAGPPPVHDMAGVQTLPAKDFALFAGFGRVIRSQHLELVIGGEAPPPVPPRGSRLRLSRSDQSHRRRRRPAIGRGSHHFPHVSNIYGANASNVYSQPIFGHP